MFKNKYRAKKVKHAGYSFASQGERDMFTILKEREDNKELTNLKCQVSVYLTDARILYKPDFSYERDNLTVYVEYKGFETAPWRIKRRLWKHYGPGPLDIYKKCGRDIYLHETIIPVGD